jgi:glycosyltransferase involved in cell wall biosynthesis
MRIWIFNHYAVTPDLPGGTRHFDFAQELAKRNYDVTIFASSFHYSLLRETKKYKDEDFIMEDFGDVSFVWFKTYPYSKHNWGRVMNMLSYSLKAYRIGKKIDLGKPDIIIGSSVHLFAVYAAYILSKHFRVPFVMEVRDLWPQTLIDMGVPKWNPFVFISSVLERFLYRKAEKIITLLPRADEYIKALGVPAEKIVWIPNGVNVERFRVNTKNLPGGGNNVQAEFTITYTGAIGKANGLNVAVRAAEIVGKDFPGIKFFFIGEGPEKPRLLQMIRERRIKNVEFKPLVPKDRIGEILTKSSVLFFSLQDLPVFKYGISSNKLFDYLAAGKPIIFSCSSVNNPVGDAGAGIVVPPDNPEVLAEAVIMLYKMPEEKRAEMGAKGKRYIEKYHAIPVLVERFEKVIREVVEKQ